MDVDIQSATVEIRRGKEEERKKKQDENNVRICYAGRPLKNKITPYGGIKTSALEGLQDVNPAIRPYA